MDDFTPKGGFNFDELSEINSEMGNNYLFIICIDDYVFCPKLYNAVRDAEAFEKVLFEKYGFTKQHTFKLTNSEATQKNILRSFSDLVDRVQPNDNLIIYFSGHGEYESSIDEGYWIPIEAKPDDTGAFISNSRITKYLKAINSRHIFLVADSCFSGSLFSERKLKSLERLESIPSRWLLSSGRNEVVSDGKPGDHSPFAENIILFLNNHEKGTLPVTKLIDHVIEATIFNSSQTPRGEPLRDVGHKGGQLFFHLTKEAANGNEETKEVVSIQETQPTGTPNTVTGGILLPLVKYSRFLISALLIASLVSGYFLFRAVSPLMVKPVESLVFGWYPSWSGDAYENLDFNSYSIVSCYSYNVDPETGSPQNSEALDFFKSSDIFDLAHNADSKVLFAITNMGRKNNEIFLDNFYLQQDYLIDSITQLIALKNVDGVDLQFTDIPSGHKEKFVQFVQRLSIKLKAGNEDLLIALHLAEANINNIYYAEVLNKHVDLFLIPGFESNEDSPNVPAPVAPLFTDGPKKEQTGIAEMVNRYIDRGIPASKLLLGLPLYGSVWTIKNNSVVEKSDLTYREIMNKINDQEYFFDSTSTSNYYIIKDEDGSDSSYQKIWFDDEKSFGIKHDWIIDQQIGGIAIWALGYDFGFSEIQDSIKSKITSPPVSVFKIIAWTLVLIVFLAFTFKLSVESKNRRSSSNITK